MPKGRSLTSKPTPVQRAVIRIRFAGANPDPRIEGEFPQGGTVSYFTGTREQWKTGVPVYSRVRYNSLYPGIDLVFYGNNKHLEYDLIVAPGSDPAQIRFGITGARTMTIDRDGNLVLNTSAGDVIQQKPRTYQRKGTELIAVAADYALYGENEVGFRLGPYDRQAPVVIDPVLRYASYITGGGNENDEVTGIAVDSLNRAVISGWTFSLNFPGDGGPEPTGAAFVLKLDFTGSRMLFVAFIAGSPEFDNVQVALDPANNIYLSGSTNAYYTFVATPGAFQESLGGQSDGWVAKLNSSGTALIYATFLGNSGGERISGIAADSAGNAYVTGSTSSYYFPVTRGAFQTECKPRIDGTCSSVFVTKLNPLGSEAVYSTLLSGHETQIGSGIAVDSSGNALLVGETDSEDFPITTGAEQTALRGGSDVFVAQLNAAGSDLTFSTFLGGNRRDSGNAIAVDSAGNAFITGRTESTDFPVKNAFQSACAGPCTFVSKVSASGRLVYSTLLGNEGGRGTGIAATPGGEAFVTGEPGARFPITQNAFQRITGAGEWHGPGIFVTKFTAAGQLSYSSYFGGGLNTPRVALDRDANAFIGGILDWIGYVPVNPGAFLEERGDESDGFVAKVVALCALSTVDRTVTLCSPSDGSTVQSPVNIIAGTTDIAPVKLTQIYVDGTKIYEAPLSALNVRLPLPGGTHRITVQALDTNSVRFKKTVYVTVAP